MALLSIENVRKEYQVRGKKVLALDSVDLTIAEGEFVTIVGPSGCGKSTLLNLIVGLMRSSMGRIVFRGAPIEGITTKIGYVTQKDNLLPWRTLIENVEIALEIRAIEKSARRAQAQDLIDQVGLSGFEDHYPHELSGGMRQRANIIRTLDLRSGTDSDGRALRPSGCADQNRFAGSALETLVRVEKDNRIHHP